MGHGCVVQGSVRFHLLEEMTHCFCEDRKLGSGSYGTVYMGESKHGEKIAVKMLHDMPGIDEEQFEKEYHNLARLQHHNIVRLVGYSHEIRREYVPYNGEIVGGNWTKRALCLEYMHNGSLDRFLYDESNGHNWCTRYAIIKGICNGLKYLHEELEPPMYHLDLKPANVLLSEDMMPKIADFALSRIFGSQQTQLTKSCIGTLGYQPPEYHDAGIISVKSDIFSLGVVIIKIMSGPKAYFRSAEMPSHQFINTVHGKWRNRLHATSEYELDLYSEQVKTCIEIALNCLEANRSKRPSIGDIVNKLNETEVMLPFGHALATVQGSSKASMTQMRFNNVVGCHDKDSSCQSKERGAHHRDISCRDSSTVCQENDRGCQDGRAAYQSNIDGCHNWGSAYRDNEADCCARRATCHNNRNDNELDCLNRGAACNGNNTNSCRDKNPMCNDKDRGCHGRDFGCRSQQ